MHCPSRFSPRTQGTASAGTRPLVSPTGVPVPAQRGQLRPSARHPPAPAARHGAPTRRSRAVPPPPRAPRGDGRFMDPVAKAQATKRIRQVGPQPTGGRCRGRASGARETRAARQMTGQLQNIKELLHLGSNETNNPLENGQRSWHVSKENTRTATKDVKKCSAPRISKSRQDTTAHLSASLSSDRQETAHAGEAAEKRGPSRSAGGDGAAAVENSTEGPQKSKIDLPCDPAYSPGYSSKRTGSGCPRYQRPTPTATTCGSKLVVHRQAGG